jgi:hypothetical protein
MLDAGHLRIGLPRPIWADDGGEVRIAEKKHMVALVRFEVKQLQADKFTHDGYEENREPEGPLVYCSQSLWPVRLARSSNREIWQELDGY